MAIISSPSATMAKARTKLTLRIYRDPFFAATAHEALPADQGWALPLPVSVQPT
jgi:hypothetical protein